MEKSTFKAISTVLLLGAVFYGGYLTGHSRPTPTADYTGALLNKVASSTDTSVDFEPFWIAWNLLEENYLPDTATSTASSSPKIITDQEKVWSAIEGLASTYDDPYTTFFPPAENEIFQTSISGNFEGVGMEIASKDGTLTVVSPLKGSPAERAGVRAGDKVAKINGEDALALGVEEAVKRIRGPKGTSVRLSLIREGEEKNIEVSIVRDVITLPTIDAKIYNKNKKSGEDVFVIRLYNFSAVSAQSFYGAMQEFSKTDTNRLVLDLRGNPGGYLESAVDIASFFLPSGKLVVKESSSKKEDSRDFRSKGFTDFSAKVGKMKLIILVDQGSASASEILAGALTEHGLGTMVGKQTFGKGSVQQLFEVTKKTSLKITVARWFTPNGKSISRAGLTPDVVVEMTEKDIKEGNDPQLDRAVELLLAQ